jgi:hypothetical protein
VAGPRRGVAYRDAVRVLTARRTTHRRTSPCWPFSARDVPRPDAPLRTATIPPVPAERRPDPPAGHVTDAVVVQRLLVPKSERSLPNSRPLRPHEYVIAEPADVAP